MQEENPSSVTMEELRSRSRGRGRGFVNAPTTTINNTSSSSSPMVMPHVAAQDFTDPYKLAFSN